MRQLIPCTACGRHHHGHEVACPHCGIKATPTRNRPVFVRRLKMGALLAFTAATTAACYDTPTIDRPAPRPSVEKATEKVPTTTNTAFMFVTPTGGATGNDTLQMEKIKLEGSRLTLSSVTVDVTATVELPSLDQLKAGTTIDLKDLKYLYAKARYFQAGESPMVQHDVVATLPGNDAVIGSLQIASVSASAISGSLTFQTATAKVSVYFNCER